MNQKIGQEQKIQYRTVSEAEANELVIEYQGWAESIARSVARAWNMDWRGDGLDGAAMEALLFCSRRFQPDRGVPFKSYSRKRIHEAASDAARRSRSWQKSVGSGLQSDQISREISSELLNVFPHLREGMIGGGGEDGGDVRGAIRQLIVGASIIAARHGSVDASADTMIDFKRTVTIIAGLEPVHQQIIWKVYWEGLSMRNVASAWETDELNVIREHQALLAFLQKAIGAPKQGAPPKVRPGLREIALRMKREKVKGPFSELMRSRTQEAAP